MNVRALSENQLITLITALTSEPLRAPFLAAPKLAPHVPDFDADLVALKGTDTPAVVEATDPTLGRTADRRAEAAFKAIHNSLLVAIDVAIAQGDDARAATLGSLEEQLFPDGRRPLAGTWPTQLGATDRMIERGGAAAPLQSISAAGLGWSELLQLAKKTNEELRKHATPRAGTPAAHTDTLATVVRRARTHLTTFMRIARDAGLASDVVQALDLACERAAKAPRARPTSAPATPEGSAGGESPA